MNGLRRIALPTKRMPGLFPHPPPYEILVHRFLVENQKMEESIRVLRFRISFDLLIGAGTMDSFEEDFTIIHLIGQLARQKGSIIESSWELFFIAKRQSFFSFFDQSAHLRKLLFDIKSSQILSCSAAPMKGWARFISTYLSTISLKANSGIFSISPGAIEKGLPSGKLATLRFSIGQNIR